MLYRDMKRYLAILGIACVLYNFGHGTQVDLRLKKPFQMVSRSATSKADFNGELWKVAAIDNWPFIKVVQHPNGTLEAVEGIEYNLLMTLSKVLNFRVQIVTPADSKWGNPEPDGTVSGLIGMVYYKEADLAIDEITITTARKTVVDFCWPHIMDSSQIISPTPKQLNKATAIFMTFHYTFWIYLCASVFIFGAIVSAITQLLNRIDNLDFNRNISQRKWSLENITFNVFKSLVWQENLMKLYSTPHRFLFIFWFFFSLNFYGLGATNNRRSGNGRQRMHGTRASRHEEEARNIPKNVGCYEMTDDAIYSGTLTAQLTIPKFEKSIDSLEDLLNFVKKNKIRFTVEMDTALEFLFSESETGVYRDVWNYSSKEDGSRNVVDGIDKVLTGEFAMANGALSNRMTGRKAGIHNFHLSRDTFYPQHYGITVAKGFPYKKAVDLVLMRTFEAGLLSKWTNDELDKFQSTQELAESKTKTAISLYQLQGAFIIWTGGLWSQAALLLENF